MEQPQEAPQFSIDLPEEIRKGQYSNLVRAGVWAYRVARGSSPRTEQLVHTRSSQAPVSAGYTSTDTATPSPHPALG